MIVANHPCNSNYISTPIKSRNSLWVIRNLLRKLFRSNNKRKVTTLMDMHYLPQHIKNDIGFWDVKPQERPRQLPYH